MKKRNILTLAILALTGLMLTALSDKKTTTIFIIGDSTAANKDISDGKQERGWGMALQSYFDRDFILVDNHAVNGRSSLSFINEGRWDKVLEKMKPGDYVIIQFGHNDEKPKADRHTDPGSTFDYNLAKFVRETREHGGTPILMNCVVRRNWLPDTTIATNGQTIGTTIDDEALRNTTATNVTSTDTNIVNVLTDTHGLYRVAPRDVAKRMNVHFVDANAITHHLEDSLGEEGSKRLHMWFLPGEEPSIPKGRQDNTHYNVWGAHQVAHLLADALCNEIPLLSRYRINADITVDKNGRGQFLSLQQAIDSINPLNPTTIQILGGEWTKPQLPKKHKITFLLKEGAKWK